MYEAYTLLNPFTTIDRIRKILYMIKQHGVNFVVQSHA